MSKSITIKSLFHNYDVDFIVHIEDLIESLLKLDSAFFVIDQNIAELYPTLISQLPSEQVFLAEATEDLKTLKGVENLMNFLISRKANRSSSLVGIGGGIIQDLVTFTSAIYYRGIPFYLVPTTLLSMCDSSIGAKCGINFGDAKNQLGVINAPRKIMIHQAFTNTLEDIDVLSGWGEVMKLAATGGPKCFELANKSFREEGIRPSNLGEIIQMCLETKRGVIEEDEYESDRRRILNYGHTFGHAIEKLSNHSVPHGVAVIWGMLIVNEISRLTNDEVNSELDKFDEACFDLLRNISVPLFDARDYLDLVTKDKKVMKGSIYLAVLDHFGLIKMQPFEIDEEFERVSQEALSLVHSKHVA